MTKDYSAFLPGGPTPKPDRSTIDALGWQAFFSAQLSVEELTDTPPIRVTQVHRNTLRIMGNGIDDTIPHAFEATVGDWLLFDAKSYKPTRLLERKSLIKRRAPGHDRSIQLIAANIETAFITTSCNADFNIARLERYIALAFEAEIDPVILLTKSDMSDDAEGFVTQAQAISPDIPVIALDARNSDPRDKLAPWCKPGRTVAFLGSSGVGKSTLTNALSGSDDIATAGIREDDARGRHTTTSRQLHIIKDGCVVLDTPGMRELQLTDATSGIEEVFADLHDLSTQCKFNDCKHDTEPGCAVTAALERGEIDAPRMARWRKLMAEEEFNSASLAQRKSKNKVLGKTIKQIKKTKPRT
jgi:ribosome biogenesis GTPase